MPYLIEGLDCSGKKTIIKKVSLLLETEGYSNNIIHGPICSKILRKFDKMLVNSYSIKPGSLRDKIRKFTYAFEPALDGMFYKETKNLNLKVSSHYRAWARAIVENDISMIRKFSKYAKKHINYIGATLLWTAFEVRISRHRYDVICKRTNKIEAKRFFNNNSEFFDSWHCELRKLMEEYIPSIIFIDTTHVCEDDISNEVYKHILRCISNETN